MSTQSAEQMKSLFKVKFSEKGSNVRVKEEQTYVFFVDFIDECEGMHAYNYFYVTQNLILF